MRTRDLVLLCAMLIVCQIIGFTVISNQRSPAPANHSKLAADLAQVQREMQNALSQLRAAQSTATHSAGTGGIALPEPEALRQLIRTVLEKELQSHLTADSKVVVSNAAAAAPLPIVDSAVDEQANRAAITQSNAVVQRALASGRWTAADNQALWPHMQTLPEPERIQIMEKIIRALERHEMQLEPGLPPLL